MVEVATKPFLFRSRINQLPYELKVKIGEVSYQKQMFATQRKELVIKLLRDYDIEFTELGTGTNRFIVKYDGFALKIALDQEGVADNKQEMVMSSALMPYVAQAHEISRGGHLLVATYAPAYTSFYEMRLQETSIRKILQGWSSRYLLGDVGLTSINYANWGVLHGKPVCIDYAYIFPSNMDIFECVCGCKDMKFTGNDYTTYQCKNCQTTYTDRELRSRISNAERLKLFANATASGIEMRDVYEEHEAPIPKEKYVNPSAPDPIEVMNAVAQRIQQEGGYW
jgi:hypothetical protein